MKPLKQGNQMSHSQSMNDRWDVNSPPKARVLAAQVSAVARVAQGVRQVGARVDVAAHVVPEAHQADVVEQEAEVPHLPATSAAAPRGSARPGLQRPRATSGQARGSEAELL